MTELPETSGLQKPIDWIDTPEALAAAAARWRRAPCLGIDSEFVRERTFYPRLGLLQISDGERCALVDPVALTDLEPLRELLAAPHVLKIAHSPSEDLEVLFHRFGEFPAPLFDTQAAAALAGMDAAMSYQRLVRELLGKEIEKGETRTDWLQRPLSPKQVEYAAQDVELLLPLHDALLPRLRELGRLDWVVDETRKLEDATRFLPPLEQAYLRLGGLGGLDRRQLGLLRALAGWREEQARLRDLPRSFVMKESSLIALARRRPRRKAELMDIPDLPARQAERLADTILALVRDVESLPPEELPPAPVRGARDERGRKLLDRLAEVTRERAEQMGMPAPVLASRRELKQLLLLRPEELPPPALAGWRWEALAEALRPLLDEARATRIIS
jgi:ribonuclease D